MSTTTDRESREDEPHPAGWRPEPKGPSRVPLVLTITFFVMIAVTKGFGWIVTIAAVVVMIFLHELGHYLTAKWAGMKVTEFFIGFGPKIWSFRRGDTEYGFKAIPAGAYVKIIGMHNLDEVPPEDESRTYRQKQYWRRMSVAVAGSTMHFILFLLLVFTYLVAEGRPTDLALFPSEAEARAANEARTTGDTWYVWVRAESPAAAAGIRDGDQLLSIDGKRVRNFDSLRDIVGPLKGDTVPVVADRDGARRTFDVAIATHPDHPSLGYLGVSPGYRSIQYGVVDGVGRTFVEFKNAAWGTVASIGKIFSPSGVSDFADQVANPDAPSTEPGSGGGGGGSGDDEAPRDRPISIIGAIGIGASLLEDGWTGLILFLAVLNMFVGIFNLIPLLPLDGGHVAIATYERIRSRRGQPYHADITKLLPLTYAVVLTLIVLGLATVYLDLRAPINL